MSEVEIKKIPMGVSGQVKLKRPWCGRSGAAARAQEQMRAIGLEPALDDELPSETARFVTPNTRKWRR